MNENEVKQNLEQARQTQLLAFYDALSDNDKSALLTQIGSTDFYDPDIFRTRNAVSARGKITPIPVMTLREINENRPVLRKAGFDAIRRGELAAVLLAGGMGTRLGTTGPKGAFDIGVTRHVFIFQRLIENLMKNAEAANTWIHLFIMTSEKNDAATRAFFCTHSCFGYDPDYIHFFTQSMAPVIDDNGKFMLESASKLATSPNGNGGWFISLENAGYGKLLDELGIKYLNVFGVDNVLQNIADPAFLGAVIGTGKASGSKVVRKSAPDEKVGVMCLEDGRPSVIEYIEETPEMRKARTPSGAYAYNYGVILNYIFRVQSLREIANKKMPMHFAHKKVPYAGANGETIIPDEPNGWKMEYFILDMIRELPDCLPFEVERDKEFAPVKNRTGNDSVETARALCRENGIEL